MDNSSSEFSYLVPDINDNESDKRASIARKLGILGIALSCLFSAITVGAAILGPTADNSSSSLFDNSSVDNSVSVADTSWVPMGYTAWNSDSNIAFKYLPVGSYSCGDYNCVKIQIISNFGCPNGLYVSANYLDGPDGNVIGYDNATLPSLNSMQSAKLMFEDTSNTSRNWQLAEIHCS
jgi:hypothetical protein